MFCGEPEAAPDQVWGRLSPENATFEMTRQRLVKHESRSTR
jgi:hypothetical protein